MSQDLVILGAGGHAKVVISTARSAGFNPVRVYDDTEEKWGTTIMGVPIVGSISEFENCQLPAVIAIGNNRVRKALDEWFEKANWVSIIHASAVVDPSAKVGIGSVVFANAVVQPECVVHRHCIVNTAATLDHDGRMFAYSQIAPGANVAGGVEIGEGAFIGIGASIHQGSKLGEWSTVGGGAFFKGELEPNLIAVGVPARPLVR